ncbi:unnamed protein product [Withania somnifera]
MAASANPPAGNSSGQEGTSNVNGVTSNSLYVLENSVVGPTQAALRHNPGLSVDWTPDEQSLLEELLAKYAAESNIYWYAKIAIQLKDKTVRDVALRCRWMSKKEIGKRRKDDQNSRKNKDKKEIITDSVPKSTHVVATRANGPPYAQSVMSMDNDGISYKAIGGTTGQLLEQNTQALDQISSNFAVFKIEENINLFTQARNNILTILNDLNDMPEIMMQMPPLPVKLNDELASLILPARPLAK